MAPSSSRDSWERLVAAVLKREQIWQLCHQDSISTISSRRPSDSSGEVLSVWSNRSRRISVSPPRQRTVASTSGVQGSARVLLKLIFLLIDLDIIEEISCCRCIIGEKIECFGSSDIVMYAVGEEDPQLHFGQVRRFSLHEVQSATDNFHGKKIIGRGINSEIYLGQLEDCSLVAVKRLTPGLQELEKELEITSISSHCNVLRLCGFCITENEQMLVYPYMVNGCVASWLRKRDESLPPLDWPVRKQIALGVAKGLAYLHHECLRKVIHRDVKAANVLLDEGFRAVLADFNLAEFTDCYDGDVTLVKGTLGHIAPEYLATGKYSVKADVFGYGVFLLELITALKSYDPARVSNEDDVMLLNRMKRSCKEKNWKTIVDSDLQGDFADEEVEKLLQIAMICTQTDPEGRPTMLEVVRMLEIGYGLAEKWEEWCKKDLKDETMELGHLRRFTMEELQHATEDFSNKIISKDGFNMVYIGYLDGSPVAVKSYNSQSLEYYYQKELDIGRNCLHPNVVHVIGFVRTPEERLLVYRLMVNGNVESWLKGRHESRRPLTWQKRKEIALGAARGLFYLHDKCGNKIIHRDIKAANIFLDENFEAAVGDFKLAKVTDRNGVRVTAAVRGTIGHIAPEYLANGECSDKTDVYSYGVFLLELVTGQSASNLLRLFKNDNLLLIDWVKRSYELGKWEGMVDEDCRGGFMETVAKQLVQIALLCTRHAPDERPRMSKVVWMLEVVDGSGERPQKEVRMGDGSSVWRVYGDYDSDDAVDEELSGPR